MPTKRPASKSKKSPAKPSHAAQKHGRLHMEPEPDPTTIDGKVERWKRTHVSEVRAKAANELARKAVKDALVDAGVNHAVTPTGTIALQARAGATTIDWEGLARKYLPPEGIEGALPEFTTVGEPTVALSAPKEWSIEAKASAA